LLIKIVKDSNVMFQFNTPVTKLMFIYFIFQHSLNQKQNSLESTSCFNIFLIFKFTIDCLHFLYNTPVTKIRNIYLKFQLLILNQKSNKIVLHVCNTLLIFKFTIIIIIIMKYLEQHMIIHTRHLDAQYCDK